MIFLPGTDQQLKFFLGSTEIKNKSILIIGAGTSEAARELLNHAPSEIIIITEDYESLMTMRYGNEKSGDKNIKVRMMDFANTDFGKDTFDIVYAQGSVSGSYRNKIVKEIKKILKPGGIFCAGEITNLRENPPAFIEDIWKSSDLLPLLSTDLERYYRDRGFGIINKKDLSYTLKDFYQQSEKLYSDGVDKLSEEEKSYYKKFLKKISHESNAYLRLGGNEFMGFEVLIMRKEQH
jgi:SAM-dependent methyltransferase